MDTSSTRSRLNEFLAQHAAARAVYQQEKKAAIGAENHATDCEEAQRVVQLVAQTVQQQAHDKIAGVVSRCLEAVFDEPYEFQIHFEQKRGRTEARLVFVRDGNEIDPMTGSGGGVVDVAAFALRVACILLSKPQVRRTLVMDEPFRFVSACYRPRLRGMLERLSTDLQMQFIQVTHIEELTTGTIIEL
jgi:DNA repair exonuclease SbcCD ATPase subunit